MSWGAQSQDLKDNEEMDGTFSLQHVSTDMLVQLSLLVLLRALSFKTTVVSFIDKISRIAFSLVFPPISRPTSPGLCASLDLIKVKSAFSFFCTCSGSDQLFPLSSVQEPSAAKRNHLFTSDQAWRSVGRWGDVRTALQSSGYVCMSTIIYYKLTF